jgi:AcrR family transcriptional regulator
VPDPADRRVRRTRGALQAALRDLLADKRYDAITVVEILARADVGRSTFYAHFQDKDALLRSAVEHVTGQLEEALPAGGGLALEPLLQHAADHSSLYRALTRGPAARLFLDELRDRLAARLAVGPPGASSPEAAIVARYHASGIVGALTWWLDTDQVPTARTTARLIEELRSPVPGVRSSGGHPDAGRRHGTSSGRDSAT